MKIRTDFVTNSSSSSFVLEIRFDMTDGRCIGFYGVGSGGEGGAGDFGELMVSVSPRQLGQAESIQELVKLLKNGVVDTGYHDGAVALLDVNDAKRQALVARAKDKHFDAQLSSFERAERFMGEVSQISDISAISRITIRGDEQGAFGSYCREYTYDRQKNQYTASVKGSAFEKNGSPGGDLCLSDVGMAVDPKTLESFVYSNGIDFLNFRNRRFATTGFTEAQNREISSIIQTRGGTVVDTAGAKTYCLIANEDYGRVTEKYYAALDTYEFHPVEEQTLIISYRQFKQFAAVPDGSVITQDALPYRIKEGTLCDVSAQLEALDLRHERSLRSIAQTAFWSCAKLKRLDLPIARIFVNTFSYCPLERVSFAEEDPSFKRAYFGDRPLPEIEMPLLHMKECKYAEAKPVLVSIYLRMQERGDELCKYYKKEYDTYLKSQRKKFYDDRTALVYMAQNRLIPAKEIPGLVAKSRAAGDLALAELLENAI